jgi:hypothetical protein
VVFASQLVKASVARGPSGLRPDAKIMWSHRSLTSDASESAPSSAGAGAELSLGSAGADGQRWREAYQAVLSLIGKLESMRAQEMTAEARMSRLRIALPLVDEVVSRVPKPVARAQQCTAGRAPRQTVAQRLFALMATNFRQALDDLDRNAGAFDEGAEGERSWLVNNLFRFLGRQIGYAVRWRRQCPEGTWALLHDLYFYLQSRKDIGFGRFEHEGAFDPETEYKRLLLLGLVARLVPGKHRSSMIFDGLASWTDQTRLESPASYGGAFDLFVVETSRDEPPKISGVLEQGFNGWVVLPPREFVDLVTGDKAGAAP